MEWGQAGATYSVTSGHKPFISSNFPFLHCKIRVVTLTLGCCEDSHTYFIGLLRTSTVSVCHISPDKHLFLFDLSQCCHLAVFDLSGCGKCFPSARPVLHGVCWDPWLEAVSIICFGACTWARFFWMKSHTMPVSVIPMPSTTFSM